MKRAIQKALLQLFSSDASEQSGLSSHIHVSGTHSPLELRHVNSSGPHVRFSETEKKQRIPKKHLMQPISCAPQNLLTHVNGWKKYEDFLAAPLWLGTY